MSNKTQVQAAKLENDIAARGVHGVHVTVLKHDGTYLEGDVASETDEIIAVQAAVESGAERVIDGLRYPGAESKAGHLHGYPPSDHNDPALDILHGANLDSRVFDSPLNAPVQTGTPID